MSEQQWQQLGTNWQENGIEHTALHGKRTAHLYLSSAACGTLQVPLSQEELEGQAKVDKLALGVAGGFNPDTANHRVEEKYFLAVVPQQLRIPLLCPDLPELVLNAVEAVQVCTFHVCKFLQWAAGQQCSLLILHCSWKH